MFTDRSVSKVKANISSTTKTHLIRGAFYLIVLLAGTLMVAAFRPEAKAKAAHRTLTFADRVAYQRAIEEVYWRHRIWPKENPQPKPSLDVLMSQAQLEKKVEGYLRDSQALEDYWQRPARNASHNDAGGPQRVSGRLARMIVCAYGDYEHRLRRSRSIFHTCVVPF